MPLKAADPHRARTVTVVYHHVQMKDMDMLHATAGGWESTAPVNMTPRCARRQAARATAGDNAWPTQRTARLLLLFCPPRSTPDPPLWPAVAPSYTSLSNSVTPSQLPQHARSHADRTHRRVPPGRQPRRCPPCPPLRRRRPARSCGRAWQPAGPCQCPCDLQPQPQGKTRAAEARLGVVGSQAPPPLKLKPAAATA